MESKLNAELESKRRAVGYSYSSSESSGDALSASNSELRSPESMRKLILETSDPVNKESVEKLLYGKQSGKHHFSKSNFTSNFYRILQ